MDQAKPTTESDLFATWPRCVQTTVAVLLALGIGFILGRGFVGYSPGRTPDDTLEVAEPARARLDLNRASRAELALVPGLGASRARSVDDYRRAHGPFTSVDELRKVPGIGPKTLEKVRPWVFVGDVGPVEPAEMAVRPASAPPAKASKTAALVDPINVNTANLTELQKLPGIGPKLAQRIVDERTLRGRFKSVDDLRRVSGIGPKRLETVRPHVIVSAPVAVAGS